MRRAVLLVLVLLALLPLSLYGCGGGGGGGGGDLAGAGGPLGEVPITVTGNVSDSTGGAGGAPDRLEAPLAGYNVKAVNATTGETLPGAVATSDSSGNFVMTFRINITADTSIVLVASDGTGANVMRSILPLVATDVQTLVNQGKTTLTVGIISPSSEQLVKNVEQTLGLTAGALGKTVVTKTVADINTEASKDNRFVLVGVTLTISGQVTDTGGGVTPPPPALTINVGSKQLQAGFGNAVNLNAIVSNAPAGAQPTFTWTQTAGPTVTLSATDVANPSFTTLNTTDAMAHLLAKATSYGAHLPPTRFGVKAMSGYDSANLTYTFKVIVTAGDRSGAATIAVSTLEGSTGLSNVGTGTVVVLQGLAQATYNWSMSFTPQNTGDTSSATLNYSDTQYPYFIPDKAGSYAVTEAVSGKSITVYAGSWWGVGVNNNNCNVCHGPNGFASGLASKFTKWAETAHATKLTSHIDGTRGGTYSASCIACHTVGYNAASQASNDGFDDKWNNPPTGTPWKIPTVLQAGNWSAMVASYPELAGRANIQCENCHGPSGSPAHGLGNASRVSMSSEVCAPCHGTPSKHGKFQLWQQSGHGNYSLTARATGSSGYSCARCHSGQGFEAWLHQAADGFSGPLIDPSTGTDAVVNHTDPNNYFSKTLGINPDTVVPQTCPTCHSPHKADKPAQLRVYNDTPVLAAGFQAKGVGKGALCMSCHNSRNGINRIYDKPVTDTTKKVVQDQPFLHEDSDPLGADVTLLFTPPTSYPTPHDHTQADLFMGRNVYFVSGTNISKHAAIEDTCVTCHMALTTGDTTSAFGSVTNHKFSVTPEEICSKCHGDGVTGAPLQAQVQALLNQVVPLQAEVVLAKLQKVTPDANQVRTIYIKGYPYDPTTNVRSTALYPATAAAPIAIDVANIDSLELTYSATSGSLYTNRFAVVFKTPVSLNYDGTGDKAVSKMDISLVNITQADGKTVIIPFNDPVGKATWNYLMFYRDYTLGIHNPTFFLKGLDATVKAMEDEKARVLALP